MTNSTTSSPRPVVCKTALIALGCVLSLVFLQIPALKAADAAPSCPASKAGCLPLTSTFEKAAGETGPYLLKLKNNSKDTIKASAKVLLSVAFHADNKARIVPEHAIDPGQTWTIPGLAATDKVTITAQGFSPLELTVP
jgi:hypothetical protein